MEIEYKAKENGTQEDRQPVDGAASLEAQKIVSQSPPEQRLFVYGSCETDQFYIDGEKMTAKKPFELTFFRTKQLKIVKIAVGGLHTLALTTRGEVYSWGCNDDGALGRKTLDEESAEQQDGRQSEPGLVALPVPVDLISAGDSHSCAANSAHGIVYQWGNFRDHSGNMDREGRYIGNEPQQIGKEQFKNRQIIKILSGAHHCLVLDDSKTLYAWGDCETHVVGRKPLARHRLQQSMRVESIKRGVEDIWTGAYHSFLKMLKRGNSKSTPSAASSAIANGGGATQNKIGVYYAWGLNNYGQLGIGGTDNTTTPTEILALRGKRVLEMRGGEHHSLALVGTEEGDQDGTQVLAWGRNDDGQLGLGEDWIQEHKQAIEEYLARDKPVEKKSVEKEEQKADVPAQDDNQQQQKQQDSFAQQTLQSAKPDRLEEPVQVEKLNGAKVKHIYSQGSYSYALSGDGSVYSWGLGLNYQLGTGEDNEYTPVKLSHEKFLVVRGATQSAIRPIEIGLGGQHVVLLEDAHEILPRIIIESVPREQQNRGRRAYNNTNNGSLRAGGSNSVQSGGDAASLHSRSRSESAKNQKAHFKKSAEKNSNNNNSSKSPQKNAATTQKSKKGNAKTKGATTTARLAAQQQDPPARKRKNKFLDLEDVNRQLKKLNDQG